jgi:predicted RNA-binding protein YlqC (UPF0109 family)
VTADAVDTDAADTSDASDSDDPVKGDMARDVLEFLAKSIVDDPDNVSIAVDEGRRGDVRLSLSVSQDDMGKVIGRRGRVAQAIRTVIRAAGAREGLEVGVDIVD